MKGRCVLHRTILWLPTNVSNEKKLGPFATPHLLIIRSSCLVANTERKAYTGATGTKTECFLSTSNGYHGFLTLCGLDLPSRCLPNAHSRQRSVKRLPNRHYEWQRFSRCHLKGMPQQHHSPIENKLYGSGKLFAPFRYGLWIIC